MPFTLQQTKITIETIEEQQLGLKTQYCGKLLQWKNGSEIIFGIGLPNGTVFNTSNWTIIKSEILSQLEIVSGGAMVSQDHQVIIERLKHAMYCFHTWENTAGWNGEYFARLIVSGKAYAMHIEEIFKSKIKWSNDNASKEFTKYLAQPTFRFNTLLHLAAKNKTQQLDAIPDGHSVDQNIKNVEGLIPIELAALHGNTTSLNTLIPGSTLKNVLPNLVKSTSKDCIVSFLKNTPSSTIKTLYAECGLLELIKTVITFNRVELLALFIPMLLERESNPKNLTMPIDYVLEANISTPQKVMLLEKLCELGINFTGTQLRINCFFAEKPQLSEQHKTLKECCEALEKKFITYQTNLHENTIALVEYLRKELSKLTTYRSLAKERRFQHLVESAILGNVYCHHLLSQADCDFNPLLIELYDAFRKITTKENAQIQSAVNQAISSWRNPSKKILPKETSHQLSDKSKDFINAFVNEFSKIYIRFDLLKKGEVAYPKDSMDLVLETAQAVAPALPSVNLQIPIIPVGVHIPTGAVVDASTAIYKYFRNLWRKKEADRMVKIFENIPMLEVMQKLEQAAKLLVRRYRDQIHHLTSEGIQKFASCVAHRVIDYIVEDESHQIASQEGMLSKATRRISDSIFSKVTPSPLLQKKSFNQICIDSITRVLNSSYPAESEQLMTVVTGEVWISKGIIENSGVLNRQYKHFAHKNSQPQTYGYIYGVESDFALRALTSSSPEKPWPIPEWQEPSIKAAIAQHRLRLLPPPREMPQEQQGPAAVVGLSS